MKTLSEQSRNIKEEADSILLGTGLQQVLERYGTVKYVGSYELDLMMKKDIDISLINPELCLEDFHKLGMDVANLLHPHSMHYRNTRVKPVKYRPPDALYWGFAFGEWNIDLWLVSEEYYLESVAYMNGIQSLLTQQNRMQILEIKSRGIANGAYLKAFGSREIYRAVLQYGVRTYEEFCGYLGEHQH